MMLKASIVSIGNEILSGQTVGTNAAYLSVKLLAISIPTVSFHTVGDNLDSIVQILQLASDEAEIVLATGGLGPTGDDLTRQAFAQLLGVKLQQDEEILQKIRDFFTSRDLQMSNKAEIQACIPIGAEALPNTLGTAPGIMAELEDKLFIAMPGVPVEMKKMFEESVLPRLKTLIVESEQPAIVVRKLRCFGVGESNIAELLGSAMKRDRNPVVNCTAEHGVVTLHIIAAAEDKDKAQQMAEKDQELLQTKLGELVFGTGQQTLAEVVGQKLTQHKKTIAVAESCTGGLISKLLTDIPGASEYFIEGWIIYSNDAKSSELGVPADLIEKYGAVSEQVAQAIAQSARKKANATFAIGITGIAGPSGGSDQKPVGLVYISVDSDSKNETQRYIFSGDRNLIRLRAAQTALNMLRLEL